MWLIRRCDFEGLPSDQWAAEALSKTVNSSNKRTLISHPAEITSSTIAQEFSGKLLKFGRVVNAGTANTDASKEFTIPIAALQALLSELGSSIVSRDKAMYLAYASQYQVCTSQLSVFALISRCSP